MGTNTAAGTISDFCSLGNAVKFLLLLNSHNNYLEWQFDDKASFQSWLSYSLVFDWKLIPVPPWASVSLPVS